MGEGGDFFGLAVNEVAASAGVAGEIMAAVPSHSYALAGFPVGYVGADGVDAAGDLVSGNARILEAWPIAFLYQHVAVADAAGFDFDPDLVAGGLWDGSFSRFLNST